LFAFTGSVVLPLKALLMNVLTIGSAYGLLVFVFQHGVGVEGLEQTQPVLLAATVFGLSTDYAVFLLSRIKEAHDRGEDNVASVASGLERTGRIVTAAAVVMVAAFSGFVAGRIVGLQEFGIGLAVAIFLDATIVRALLVPSLMALFGRYNWWLPENVARVMRVPPSPLEPRSPPALRAAAR